MALRDIFWQGIPPTRVGVFSGRIKCPCEVQFWNTLERFFHDPSAKTLVDLGCGPGIKALTLTLAGAQSIGFDARKSAIQHARENLRQIQDKYPQKPLQADFFHRDIEAGVPEIADASADYVLFVEVIEHLRNYPQVLAEIRRILKPGGKVMITTPNKTMHRKGPDEQVYGEKAYGHVCEFDLETLVKEVEHAGLTLVDKGYLNTRASTMLCKWIHPWMIRDHAFLQRKANIDDVIGIRTLGFLQPLYNQLFFLISAIIAGYNRLLFPVLSRLVTPTTAIIEGKTIFVVGTICDES